MNERKYRDILFVYLFIANLVFGCEKQNKQGMLNS